MIGYTNGNMIVRVRQAWSPLEKHLELGQTVLGVQVVEGWGWQRSFKGINKAIQATGLEKGLISSSPLTFQP